MEFFYKFGTFKFEVMTFGLINDPSTFQRLMEEIFKDEKFVRAYLDEVVIFYKALHSHVEDLKFIVDVIKSHSLKVMLKKCYFGLREVSLLGNIVDGKGVRME